jgi:hypothetical protein
MSIDTTEPIGQVFYAADGGDDETGAGYYMKACVHWFGKAPAADTKLYTTPQASPGQAEVTDEREAFESCTLMEGSLFKRRADDPDKYWYGGVQDLWELWQARAILTPRPGRVPMTDEQIRSMCKQGWVFETVRQWVHVVEAHHGITAQAKKGTP